MQGARERGRSYAAKPPCIERASDPPHPLSFYLALHLKSIARPVPASGGPGGAGRGLLASQASLPLATQQARTQLLLPLNVVCHGRRDEHKEARVHEARPHACAIASVLKIPATHLVMLVPVGASRQQGGGRRVSRHHAAHMHAWHVPPQGRGSPYKYTCMHARRLDFECCHADAGGDAAARNC